MTHGSLFSGGGGFDLASEWAGWTNKFNCEIEPFCKTILKYYWPDAIQYDDIRTTDFTVWRGKIDVLTGGFPCQPFSQAGKRKGTEDERHLWPQMLRAIREIRPRWIVGENVRGIINWSDGLVFEQVCADLEDKGYEVQPYLLPAAGVGAPHERYRTWFIAKNTDNIRRNCCKREEESEEWRQRFAGPGDYDRLYRKENDSTDSADTGFENVQREQEDTVLPVGASSDTPHRRCGRWNCEGCKDGERQLLSGEQAGCSLGSEIEGCCGEWLDSHTNGKGLAAIGISTGTYSEEWGFTKRHTEQFACTNGRALYPTPWENFPTQPPVCSRDDELSGRLDGITFPKWRQESIKLYGNAVVPYLVYQLFDTINQFEKLNPSRSINRGR